MREGRRWPDNPGHGHGGGCQEARGGGGGAAPVPGGGWCLHTAPPPLGGSRVREGGDHPAVVWSLISLFRISYWISQRVSKQIFSNSPALIQFLSVELLSRILTSLDITVGKYNFYQTVILYFYPSEVHLSRRRVVQPSWLRCPRSPPRTKLDPPQLQISRTLTTLTTPPSPTGETSTTASTGRGSQRWHKISFKIALDIDIFHCPPHSLCWVDDLFISTQSILRIDDGASFF